MKIISITKVKPKTVYAIKTSTSTYIADGLAHHNCAGCNLFGAGEQYKHGMAIDAKYGDGTAKALEVKAHTYFKVTRQYLEEVIADSKTEIKWYEDNLINKKK
jgi:hypothetical protein